MKEIKLIEKDKYLEPFRKNIEEILSEYEIKENKILKKNKILSKSVNDYLYFGFHYDENFAYFREWAPNATNIWLIGDFNNWQKDNFYKFSQLENGNWELKIAKSKIKHKDLYKLIISWNGGEGERIPAFSTRVVQDDKTKLFASQVWMPSEKYNWKYDLPNKNPNPLIYEAHIGMSSEEGKVSTYKEFKDTILPKIIKLGYNVIQLMAIQEHPYYGSFGYHVSSFYAPSSRFGTPEELKELIDEIHKNDILVIMDLVHSHAVKNEVEGLSRYDGTTYQFFHEGSRGEHIAWDSRCFDYSKNEVLHFLLSNCKYWIEEYNFDGFRFDGVTSMIFKNHGLEQNFLSYNDYYNDNLDTDALVYLKLANKLIHQIKPQALTIAEDMSGLPGIASSLENGGFGFDFRLAMGIPDFWIKYIKELKDEEWNVGEIYYRLTDKRTDEKTISYTESHDQALVGDKTIIFRLIDADMYYYMNKGDKNLIVSRGIALHKMIKLATISTSEGGYLNFMGNEFGHPEWIDFPREGNNWSYHYARRQWSLSENKQLKYEQLLNFDIDMINLIKAKNILNNKSILIRDNIYDKVLIFKRSNYLFVFNFHPTKSFADYGVEYISGKWKIVLNSDNIKYGGFGLIDEETIHESQLCGDKLYLKLYIPSRTAIVLKSIKS